MEVNMKVAKPYNEVLRKNQEKGFIKNKVTI